MNTTLFRKLLPYLLLLPVIPGMAQETSKTPYPYSVGLQTFYGSVLIHRPYVGSIITYHPFGVELYYEQIKDGRQYWQRAYQYPKVGLALGVFNSGSPQVGQIVYLINYLEKKLNRGQRGELNFKIGWGLGYCDNPFNLEKNFQNKLISSPISFSLRGGIGYSYAVSPKVSLKAGLVITHFSNGAFKMPNSGINLITTGLGVSYTPQGRHIEYRTDPPAPKPWKKWSLNLASAFTIKEFGLPGGPKYPGFVLMAHVSRRLNYKSALNAGLDGIYNTALRAEIAQDPNVDPRHRPDFKRAGLVFGHELYISQRVSLLTQMGVYIYKHYQSQVDAPIYQRYGLKYYMHEHLFAGMSLKAHYGTADFVEWTVGVNL